MVIHACLEVEAGGQSHVSSWPWLLETPSQKQKEQTNANIMGRVIFWELSPYKEWVLCVQPRHTPCDSFHSTILNLQETTESPNPGARWISVHYESLSLWHCLVPTQHRLRQLCSCTHRKEVFKGGGIGRQTVKWLWSQSDLWNSVLFLNSCRLWDCPVTSLSSVPASSGWKYNTDTVKWEYPVKYMEEHHQVPAQKILSFAFYLKICVF